MCKDSLSTTYVSSCLFFRLMFDIFTRRPAGAVLHYIRKQSYDLASPFYNRATSNVFNHDQISHGYNYVCHIQIYLPWLFADELVPSEWLLTKRRRTWHSSMRSGVGQLKGMSNWRAKECILPALNRCSNRAFDIDKLPIKRSVLRRNPKGLVK